MCGVTVVEVQFCRSHSRSVLESSCNSCLICELDNIINVGICMQYSLSQESVLRNALFFCKVFWWACLYISMHDFTKVNPQIVVYSSTM